MSGFCFFLHSIYVLYVFQWSFISKVIMHLAVLSSFIGLFETKLLRISLTHFRGYKMGKLARNGLRMIEDGILCLWYQFFRGFGYILIHRYLQSKCMSTFSCRRLYSPIRMRDSWQKKSHNFQRLPQFANLHDDFLKFSKKSRQN